MDYLKIIYGANIVVAGWVGLSALFFSKSATTTVFGDAYAISEYMKLVGSLWLAIAILSVFGLFKPIVFCPVLLIQLIYKGIWLLIVALPALISGNDFPKGMALFFLIWVIVLPFVIPWKYIFA